MAARLGLVLYWLGATVGLICAGLAVAGGIALYINNPADYSGGLILVVGLGLAGLAAWLIGLACRFVLAGPKERPKRLSAHPQSDWFYVDHGETKGPVAISELRALLAKTPDADEVLIWNAKFSDWQRAGDSPDLRAGPNVKPSIEKSGPWYTNSKFITSLAVVLFVVGSQQLRKFEERTKVEAKVLTGEAKSNFISEGLQTCRIRQRKEPDNKTITDAQIERYCSCYMNELAEKLTAGQLRGFAETPIPEALMLKVSEAGTLCAQKILQK